LSERQEDGIRELTKRLAATGRIDSAEGFSDAVLRREEALPTIAENGTVFPHARGQAVRSFSLAIGLSSDGVPWGERRESLAHAIFLSAVPLSDSGLYLSVLSTLSSFLSDELAAQRFRACSQPEEMLRLLNSVHIISRSHRTHGHAFRR
jgi:PTS system fructose-specific IIC component